MRKNVIFMALYQLLILIVPFITLPYVSRILGPQGIGIAAYSDAVVGYFMLISQLGIHLYGKREIAKVNQDTSKRSSAFIEIFYIQLFMSIISIIFYLAFVLFFFDNYKRILLIQSIMLFSSLLDISWLYFGMEKFKITILRNMIVKLISIIFIFMFINSSDDLSIYIFVIAISTFISQIIMWFNIKKYITFNKINFRGILKRFYPILKLFIPVLAIQLYVIVDKTMLGIFSNVQEVGLFENANKITRVPILVITSLGIVMLPRMTNLIATGKDRIAADYIEKSLLYTMFIAFAFAFGMFGVSNTFVPLFLGEAFSDSIILVKILTPILIFISWGNVFRTQYILPNGLDNLYTKSVIYAAGLNILLNFVLIKYYGAIGAALASIISESLICIYQSVKIKSKFRMGYYLKNCIKYFVSGLIMMVIVMFIGKIYPVKVSTVIFQILVGAVFYFLLSIILEKLFKQELIINEIKKIVFKLTRMIKLKIQSR
ncbi:oligosaccharide flippase family protein [Paenibacillus sp. RS8]|uniref:oligosaccharide flippase family protein n=1 Tax=Paenibacillus sp. RS8 TaxID=3242681 RepID=UPI0035C15C8B